MNKPKEECKVFFCPCYSCIYNCEGCYNTHYMEFNSLTVIPDECFFLSKTNLMCKDRKVVSNMKEGNNDGSN